MFSGEAPAQGGGELSDVMEGVGHPSVGLTTMEVVDDWVAAQALIIIDDAVVHGDVKGMKLAGLPPGKWAIRALRGSSVSEAW